MFDHPEILHMHLFLGRLWNVIFFKIKKENLKFFQFFLTEFFGILIKNLVELKNNFYLRIFYLFFFFLSFFSKNLFIQVIISLINKSGISFCF